MRPTRQIAIRGFALLASIAFAVEAAILKLYIAPMLNAYGSELAPRVTEGGADLSAVVRLYPVVMPETTFGGYTQFDLLHLGNALAATDTLALYEFCACVVDSVFILSIVGLIWRFTTSTALRGAALAFAVADFIENAMILNYVSGDVRSKMLDMLAAPEPFPAALITTVKWSLLCVCLLAILSTHMRKRS